MCTVFRERTGTPPIAYRKQAVHKSVDDWAG
jgi:hypothetical protein